MTDSHKPGASLLPNIQDLRSVSTAVAIEVAKAAIKDGVARVEPEDVEQAIKDAMWNPVYKPVKAMEESEIAI